MPPIRAPINTKGLKTERTHEENQERAYIAASRRSDRSLEARIESARRASEIHKKRTGRALRVTEQDVINEEMYEEEDDDLQAQYRRLQAHLGSTADAFNGRLNAWILSAYGTRQMALAAQNGMMFNPSMSNMPPPTTPFFAYQPQQQSSTGAISPGLTQRNQSYRQAPYPPQHQRSHEGRSHSISSLPDNPTQSVKMEPSANAQTLQHQRRHSMATGVDETSSSGTHQRPGDMGGMPISPAIPGFQPGYLGHPAFTANSQLPCGGFPMGTSTYDPMMSQMQGSISPLTTSLPVEAQQIIGTSFDPHGQYTPMFMNMSHGLPVPQGVNYTYRPNFGASDSSSNVKDTSDGINQTLSPNPMASPTSKIDASMDNLNTPTLSNGSLSSNDMLNPHFATAVNLDGNYGLGMSFDKTPADTSTSDTPDGFFNDWFDSTTVDEPAQ
ncbi:uncharacterized protein PV09_05866 [Verruconis gallopava]|uniref:Uncharacterized protein n=1 Tax=Verruconis gallopava TaxID=253628 RepID=A0A0D2A883_9PEZI|nr:uncharacterized protein PV09_05866 [Verruconis gallopava]KIW02805.1 hypothetical protein PV09_05866 [Verruconis gallopava]